MSDKSQIESARFCILMCWVGGIVGGLILAVLVVKLAGFHPLAGLFLGFLAAMTLAFLFYWLFCDEERDAAARAANAWVEPDELPEADELPEEAVADTVPEVADAGEEDPVAAEAPAEAPDPAPTATTAPETAAAAAPETKSVVQPSKALAGEADLASRKGEWRYGEEAAPTAKASEAKAPAAEAAPAKPATGEAAQPQALDGARGGKADNLKEIKGVGPKLEQLLNSLGIYHFDQIAGWNADEVAWMDDNLKGFKGRVSRDDWIGQAKVLASGGETEFSKRVEDGDVY